MMKMITNQKMSIKILKITVTIFAIMSIIYIKYRDLVKITIESQQMAYL